MSYLNEINEQLSKKRDTRQTITNYSYIKDKDGKVVQIARNISSPYVILNHDQHK